MNGIGVIIGIAIVSLIAPFIVKLQRSAMVWITLGIVNLIIITLFVVVKDSSPQKLNAAHLSPVPAASAGSAK